MSRAARSLSSRPIGMIVAATANVIVALVLIAVVVRLIALSVDEDYAAVVYAHVPRLRTLILASCLHVAGVSFLVAATVGYVRCNPRLGQGAANAYIIVELGAVVFTLTALRMDFDVLSAIRIVYVVVTGVLVNVVFAPDFDLQRRRA